MELQPGMMLTDRLRLERELGHGAMGSVWVATHLTLQSQVAVKVMKACDSDEQLRRFQAEARGLASLQSPHVVRIFDFGVCSDNEPFIVMELLDGEDLRTRIERVGPMPLEEVALILRQLCAALASAHEKGVVHRDIKPANIFLTRSGNETFVKVLDFGVAKFIGPELNMTSTGMLLGTPYYASPEQLLDPKDVDHRADLWSAAVVVYACLTGQLPFIADTLSALTIAIYEGRFQLPTALRSELPTSIDIWMARALSQNPADRHPSALALSELFSTATRGPRIDASAPPQHTVVMEEAAAERHGATQEGFGPAPAPSAHHFTAAASSVPSLGATEATPPHQLPFAAPGLAQSTLSPMSASMAAPVVRPAAKTSGVRVWPWVAALGVAGGALGVGLWLYQASSGASAAAAASVTANPPIAVETGPSALTSGDVSAPPIPSAAPSDAQPSAEPSASSTPPPAPVAAPPGPRRPRPLPVARPPVRPSPVPEPPAPPPTSNNPFQGKRK